MISYIGGKKLHAKWISPLLPKKCETYVEVFGGAFWIYFMSKIQSAQVVYNDINPQLSNLFNCASKDPKKLLTQCLLYKEQDSDLFIKFRDELFTDSQLIVPNSPDFIQAAKFVYCQTQIFSGNTFSDKIKMTDLKGKYTTKYQHFISKLQNEKYLKKLSNITNVENSSFEHIINTYDSEDTLFYIDPPYYKLEHYYTFDKVVHTKLMEMLVNIKGKFALSYYDFDELQDYFPKDKYVWTKQVVNKQNGNRKQINSSKGVEILIRNFETKKPQLF